MTEVRGQNSEVNKSTALTTLLSALCLSCAMLFALSSPLEAQQPAKIHKVGWLFLRPAEGSYGSEMTRRAFRDLGYVENKNIVFEVRRADNRLDRLPALADELVRLKVDVILAASTNAALAAKNATGTIPIIFVSMADPVVAGLVDSLPRPGGNLTGFTTIAPVLTGKRFELLKETIPGVARIALLWNPKNPGSTQDWKESLVSARELGLQLHSMEVSSADKFDSAFKEATTAGSRGIAVTLDALINSNQKRIADLAIKHRITAAYSRGDFAESGGLLSYGPEQAEPYNRVASMVDKVLKGAKPAELPVEQPTKFELVINLKTANQIGVTIPQSVLYRADKVIR
jgi:putative ABC transport system substrate-binding protein